MFINNELLDNSVVPGFEEIGQVQNTSSIPASHDSNWMDMLGSTTTSSNTIDNKGNKSSVTQGSTFEPLIPSSVLRPSNAPPMGGGGAYRPSTSSTPPAGFPSSGTNDSMSSLLDVWGAATPNGSATGGQFSMSTPARNLPSGGPSQPPRMGAR